MNKLSTIGEVAKYLGVSAQTLRRWEKQGKGLPFRRTTGNQRRYNLADLGLPMRTSNLKEQPALAYARVSSHDQKEDLQRQEKMLQLFCSSNGWTFEIVSDLGSGMNYHKKGLKILIRKIMGSEISRLVLTHKDRLLRFGAELIFSLCEQRNIEVVLINKGDEPSFEEELASDVLEIITVFSARLYGSRSHKNKKLLENLKEAATGAKQGA